MYFALWAVLFRRHYRQVHQLHTDDWVLNAHAMWLLLVGSQLVRSSLQADGDAAGHVGFGAAAGLAATDFITERTSDLAPIYRSDMVFESLIAAAWVASRSRTR